MHRLLPPPDAYTLTYIAFSYHKCSPLRNAAATNKSINPFFTLLTYTYTRGIYAFIIYVYIHTEMRRDEIWVTDEQVVRKISRVSEIPTGKK